MIEMTKPNTILPCNCAITAPKQEEPDQTGHVCQSVDNMVRNLALCNMSGHNAILIYNRRKVMSRYNSVPRETKYLTVHLKIPKMTNFVLLYTVFCRFSMCNV